MTSLSRPLLRLGSTDPAVAEVRAILRKVGCWSQPGASSHEPVDRDGADRVAAAGDVPAVDEHLVTSIRFFQQSHGLKADGIVGPQTWARLLEARWDFGERVLQLDASVLMRGRDVTALQRRLSDLGFDCGRVDGIFGPRTDAALREFQENMGLTVDGVCGADTVATFHGLARAITGGRAERLRDAHSFDEQRTGLAGKVIVLDPGHGGDDAGSTGHGLVERDVVADIALRLEQVLAEHEAVVLITRAPHADSGDALDDEARALFANSQQADAVISLHLDWSASEHPNGVAAFYYGGGRSGGHSETGHMLAWELVESLSASTGLTNLRAHTRQWDLLRLTTMPAVRLYMGYVSNPGDAAKFADDTFRQLVAQSLAHAIAVTFTPVAVGV